MRIFKKIADNVIPTPRSTQTILFTDSDGQLSLKDDAGSVRKFSPYLLPYDSEVDGVENTLYIDQSTNQIYIWDGTAYQSIANNGYSEVDARPTTLPLGTMVEFQGDLYKPAGTYVASLTGCDPELAIRQTGPIYFAFFSPQLEASSWLLHYGNTLNFANIHQIWVVSRIVIDYPITVGALPYVREPIQYVLNANLLVNLCDYSTSKALRFSGSYTILRTAIVQFFTDLPTVQSSLTATIDIQASLIVGGPLSAPEIEIATDKGYTVTIS